MLTVTEPETGWELLPEEHFRNCLVFCHQRICVAPDELLCYCFTQFGRKSGKDVPPTTAASLGSTRASASADHRVVSNNAASFDVAVPPGRTEPALGGSRPAVRSFGTQPGTGAGRHSFPISVASFGTGKTRKRHVGLRVSCAVTSCRAIFAPGQASHVAILALCAKGASQGSRIWRVVASLAVIASLEPGLVCKLSGSAVLASR